MRRALAAALAVAALVGLLSACGEDDPFERYCDVVREEQAGLTRDLGDAGTAGLLPALPAFERLEDAAPDDIADDWSVITQRLTGLADALDDAGVDPSTYDATDPPADTTPEQREAIGLAAGAVATEEVREALGVVQQQARDVCGTELTLS
ncbi:hypothetical protein [Nocardioides litoris]|uniref:hypothetical protein n=1 Tax=Nocardioides litoris TaxID=1926648 RepID=UPI0011237AC7|nr:hypothetical protein [Nocardioides litoris]